MKTLFVTGMARSGTSWLLKLFACHPDALCLYEPFNLIPMRQGLPGDLRFWELLPRLRKMVEKGKIEQAVRDFGKPVERFSKVRDHRLDRAPLFPQPENPRLMVIKEDFNGLEEVCGAYGKVLHITRDPRAVLNSLWNHTAFGRGYGAVSTVSRWADALETMRKLHQDDPDTYEIVRYEDLVGKLEPAILLLHQWAGLDEEIHPQVRTFLEATNARHEKDPYSVFKDPKQVEAAWKRELSKASQELVRKALKGRKALEFYPELES